MSNGDIHKDIYYEVRIGTAMLVLIIVMNLLLLLFAAIASFLWLDSYPKVQYNGSNPKGETQNVQVP